MIFDAVKRITVNSWNVDIVSLASEVYLEVRRFRQMPSLWLSLLKCSHVLPISGSILIATNLLQTPHTACVFILLSRVSATITRRHECLICGLVAPDYSQLFDRLWSVHHSPGIGNQCLYYAKMEKLWNKTNGKDINYSLEAATPRGAKAKEPEQNKVIFNRFHVR